MNDEWREAPLGLGRGHKGDDTGDRCSKMNGDSPCNQGRGGVLVMGTASAGSKAQKARSPGGWENMGVCEQAGLTP